MQKYKLKSSIFDNNYQIIKKNIREIINTSCEKK